MKVELVKWRSGQVVRRRSRKPKIGGSSPPVGECQKENEGSKKLMAAVGFEPTPPKRLVP